jgi:antitoxin MazE
VVTFRIKEANHESTYYKDRQFSRHPHSKTCTRTNVELEVEKNQIIIRPISKPRAGWENAFKTMAEKGDDELIYGTEYISHSWDEEEWQW